jgi:hypothetical protein
MRHVHIDVTGTMRYVHIDFIGSGLLPIRVMREGARPAPAQPPEVCDVTWLEACTVPAPKQGTSREESYLRIIQIDALLIYEK